MRQHNTTVKLISLFIALIILFTLLITLSTSAYAAPCPPTCNEAELATLAATNPQQAYNINPDLAIKSTGGKILDNHDIAHDYFTKHPDKMKEYRKFAQNYFMTKGKINRNLMKTYLSKDVSVHDEQDIWIARKYLTGINFKDSTDRTIFRFYMRDVKAMTAQDKAIAKSFFTAENGKYINENMQNVRELFKKYLKAEGVEVVAINGPVKAFTRDGTLSGKNAKVNIYNLKEKAGFRYALKVESDGSLTLSQTQFEIKKKEEFKITEKAKQEQMGTSKWDALWSVLGIDDESEAEFFVRKSLEKAKETPQTEISEEIVTTYEPGFYPTDVKVPFEGDLELTDGGKIKLKQGKIRHVDVKGAEEVTADARSFSGKFEEVAGVEFKTPSHVKMHTISYTIEETGKKGVYYNLEGQQANDGGMPIINKIKAYTFKDYTQFSEVSGKEIPEEVKTDFSGAIDANGIILSGNYLINDYDVINPKRDIVAPAYGNSLMLNNVKIFPITQSYTRILFPNKPVTEELKSENYVSFTKEGVTVNGAGTKALITPSGLVQNEIAATGKTTGLVNFPKRGYFQVGDKDEYDSYGEGTFDYTDIKNHFELLPISKIQSIVGLKDISGIYDKETVNAVKEWQKTQILNGRHVKPDGLFGKESLMAYLQNNEGDIFLAASTNSDYNQGKVSYNAGKLKIDTLGDLETVRVGAKEYVVKTTEKNINDKQLALGEAAPVDVGTIEGAASEYQLNQIAGLNPFFVTKDLGMPYELNVEKLSHDVDSETSAYVPNPNSLKYYQFDRQAIYQQTGNLIDALVNPELVKEGVEINPEFKEATADGKLTMLYLVGKMVQGKEIMDRDTNILFTDEPEPKEAPSPKRYTKTFQTKDGDNLEVEVVVVWSSKDAETELKNREYDIFHMKTHSRSIEKQGLYLGPGRGVFSTKELKLQSKSFKRPRLVSINSCIATKRVLPGMKEMFKYSNGPKATYLVSDKKITEDTATSALAGVLTGLGAGDIARLENEEEGIPTYTVVEEKPKSITVSSAK